MGKRHSTALQKLLTAWSAKEFLIGRGRDTVAPGKEG